MMPITKVNTRHQITIPSEARRVLGIQPGDRLSVEIVDDGLLLRKRHARASDRLWGIGRGLYGPDPVTFVQVIRDELEANVREREDLVTRGSGQTPRARCP